MSVRFCAIGVLVGLSSACAGTSEGGKSKSDTPAGTSASATQTAEPTGSAPNGNGASEPVGSVSASADPGSSEQESDARGRGGFLERALALCKLVNEYRVSQGLVAIPLSTALMTVAERHANDLALHPEIVTDQCNLHSWSDKGEWTPCCYDKAQETVECMWQKPRQITAAWGKHHYDANGYEISANGAASPRAALEKWKNSPEDHAMLVNSPPWDDESPWSAMGCGIKKGFAVVWFGEKSDSQRP